VTARFLVTGVAILALLAGIVLLERPRAGLEITHLRAGQTPVTVMQEPGADGPLVVIAHGFAGSRQLMAAWQLTLAQAGYVTASFDFEGHGRNPVPMSGDVTSIDGTTQLLMDEIGRVTDAVWRRPAPSRAWRFWGIPWPPTSSSGRASATTGSRRSSAFPCSRRP
jgi:predicted alpha/beta-fold hydrolase